MLIAHAINNRFTTSRGGARRGVAEAKTDRIIEFQAPEEYDQNIGRFVQVVINLVFAESTNQRMARLEELQVDMLDPTLAKKSALRLEGIGKDAIPTLRRALKSEHLEVRFHAAQALAYMDLADGVDVLKAAAKDEPAFRWHALTALSSIEETEAGMALADLLHVDSAETRYGSFRAMRARSENDPLIVGQKVSNFYLHRIPSKAEPMLHFSRSKRPEIVVFGDQQKVNENFISVESGTTIQATGDDEVSISRYLPGGEVKRLTCSNRVADIIEILANSGMEYGDILRIFRGGKSADGVDSRIMINAVPKLGRAYVPDPMAANTIETGIDQGLTDSISDEAIESTFTNQSDSNRK